MTELSIAKNATADPDKVTALKTFKRVQPIVIIPGTMGTRLSDPITHKLAWNPTAISPFSRDAGSGIIDMKILSDINHKLVPDRWNRLKASDDNFDAASRIDGYYNLIADFYGDLCIALQSDRFTAGFRKFKTIPKVNCAGYDWRQDNAISALDVYKTIVRAADECGRDAIVIGHSQGGIVARQAFRTFGADKLKDLILLGSPTLGAPKGYNVLKSGDLEDWKIKFLALRVFRDSTIREFVRHFPSAYQLAPTALYGKKNPDWLKFSREDTGKYWDGAILRYSGTQIENCNTPQHRIYNDPYLGFNDLNRNRLNAAALTARTEALHLGLLGPQGDPYMPGTPWCVYTGDITTTYQIKTTLLQATDEYVLSESSIAGTCLGDGTVPADSANPTATTRLFCDTLKLSKVAHSDIPNHPKTIDHIQSIIHMLNDDYLQGFDDKP